MSAKFVYVDRETPMLISPNLQEWLPRDHLVRFVVEVVESAAPAGFHVNEKGTGSLQYPPLMMCSLLIYCYITGRFSSRQIERASYDDLAVRFLTADTHPDHDTICTFRRENAQAFSALFVRVLELAEEVKVLKRFGTVSVDGTKILANASRHKAVSYDRAGQMIERLEQEVLTLTAKAEAADSAPLQDGLSIPAEIARREERLEKLKAAKGEIERRARQRAEAKLAEKLERREARQSEGQRVGKEPVLGACVPKAKAQYNFTDPESRIMKTGNGQRFDQAYNAQAAVDIDSRLIVAQCVTDETNDKKQLAPVVGLIDPNHAPETILADSGYFSEEAVQQVEEGRHGQPTGTKALIAVGRKAHHRTVEDLEKRAEPPASVTQSAHTPEGMAQRLRQPANRALYAQRKQTVEPVFGIIKEAMGFRRFSMRGKRKAADEWTLVSTSYNIKRLFHLGLSCARKQG